MTAILTAVLGFYNTYKDWIIVLAIILFTAGVYWKGGHDMKVSIESAQARIDLKTNQEYIRQYSQAEKENELGLKTKLDQIKADKSGDGDVAPVLRNALSRLRPQ